MNGFIPMSDELAGLLGLGLVGGETSRFEVAYSLARGLQLSTSRLGPEVCRMLLELLPALEAFCQPGTTDAAGAAKSSAHKVVADVADETDVDTILLVFEQMDMAYFAPPIVAQSAPQFRRDIRLRLQEVLDPLAFQMIDKWRMRDPSDRAPQRQSRVIRSDGRH